MVTYLYSRRNELIPGMCVENPRVLNDKAKLKTKPNIYIYILGGRGGYLHVQYMYIRMYIYVENPYILLLTNY